MRHSEGGRETSPGQVFDSVSQAKKGQCRTGQGETRPTSRTGQQRRKRGLEVRKSTRAGNELRP